MGERLRRTPFVGTTYVTGNLMVLAGLLQIDPASPKSFRRHERRHDCFAMVSRLRRTAHRRAASLRVAGPLRVERFRESTHWIQHDEPQRVSDLLIEFLAA